MCSCFLTSIYTAFVLSLVVHTSDCALSENERAVLGVGVGGAVCFKDAALLLCMCPGAVRSSVCTVNCTKM